MKRFRARVAARAVARQSAANSVPADVWAGKLAVVTTLATGFNGPQVGVILSSSTIVVADANNNLIRLVTYPGGVVTTLAGNVTGGSTDGTGSGASFNLPRAATGLPNGNIVVSDTSNYRIRLVTPAGVVTTLAGSSQGFSDGTGTNARFDNQYGLNVLPNGTIVVADTSNNRIRLVTAAGVVTTLAGSTQGFADGTGAGAQFSTPYGVAVLLDGNIVVADSGNNRIRVITPAGVVTTLAGGFNDPRDVAVLPNGNIVVSETYTTRLIRLVTYPGGVMTTLAGSGTNASTDGTGTAASFANPRGLTVLPNGTVVVSDLGSSSIRLITPT